jgi:hypothetical protein
VTPAQATDPAAVCPDGMVISLAMLVFAERCPGSWPRMTDGDTSLEAFLDEAFDAQERISSGDLQRRAVAADLPAALLTRFDALPEGEYAQDEALEALNGLPG